MINPIESKPQSKPDISKVTHEHRQTLNSLVKAIIDTKMDRVFKETMLMRVWGQKPDVFDPMTYKRIAKFFKHNRVFDKSMSLAKAEIMVEAFETRGHAIVKAHLDTVSMKDIIGRFNSDVNRAKMFGG